MADTYPNFAALAQHERSGIDYRVVVRRAEPAFAIMAPHGGGIEPGTSEIADAIAAGNIPSTRSRGSRRRGMPRCTLPARISTSRCASRCSATPGSSSLSTVRRARKTARACFSEGWISHWSDLSARR